MQNLIVSIQVVLPLLLMMLVGVLVRRCGLIDEAALNKLDAVAFKVFLPVLLFQNLYELDLAQAFNPGLMAFMVISVLAVFALSMLLIPRFEKDSRKRAAIIQTIIRSNYLIFGLAVAANLYGEGNTACVALMGSIFVPMSNALAVFVLEYYRSGKTSARQIIRSIFKNPLVIGAIAGLAVMLLHIPMPVVVKSTVKSLSAAATPLCLLTLGGSLHAADAKANARQITLGLVSRMVLVPGILLPLAVIMGFRNEALLALTVLFASPTAVSSHTMARQMGADGPLAGQLVAFTTGVSFLTIFLFVLAFKELGFL